LPGHELANQVDVLSRAVEISADGRAPEVRAAFSSRAAEPRSLLLWGKVSSAQAQRDTTAFTGFLEGAFRSLVRSEQQCGKSVELILDDQRKGVFL
jgi:hypothetical protein